MDRSATERSHQIADVPLGSAAAELLAAEKRTSARLTAIEDTLESIRAQLSRPHASSPASGGSLGGSPSCEKPPAPSQAMLGSQRTSSPLTPSQRASFVDQDSAPSAEDRLAGVGTLTIVIKSAANLIQADLGGSSDPYCVVRLAQHPARRTSTKKKTLNPQWHERIEYDCELRSLVDETLQLELFDEDFHLTQAIIGGAKGLVGGMMAKGKGSAAEQAHGDVDRSTTKSHAERTTEERSFVKKHYDDKLGVLSSVSLAFLHEKDSMEFEAEPLADVKSGSITFSISWVEASDGDNEVTRAPK
jgi:hypothetical protein